MKPATVQTVGITVIAVLSTYWLRAVLGFLGLQVFTFLVPVLFAAYVFGSRLALLAAVLSLAVAHAILWNENPAALFTRGYGGALFNFIFFSGLIVLYTHRHERVLVKLDDSLKRAETARKDAEEANRLKDQFLATLSHELRTPINVILGYLQILLGERSRDPRKALEIVHRNAQQQARLIEDVLDVSRITTGSLQLAPELVSPAALLHEAVESLQPAIAARALTVDVQTDDADVLIWGDPHRLRQIFWNLLSNAVKFTPVGGNIALTSVVHGDHVELSVRDSGRGISADFLPHVFEMFRQADPTPTREVSGMGLGLNLVKRLVEMHGGEVSAQSAGEGLGATFTCRFPVHPSGASVRPFSSARRRALH